jgi:hypothetical protein
MAVVVHEGYVERRQVKPSPRGAHDEQGRYDNREENKLRGLDELVLAGEREHRRRHYEHPQDETGASEEVVKKNARW